MTDCYVVRNGDKIIGASLKQQGAELIRADAATQITDAVFRSITGGAGISHDSTRWQNEYQLTYDRMEIHNTERQDDDE